MNRIEESKQTAVHEAESEHDGKEFHAQEQYGDAVNTVVGEHQSEAFEWQTTQYSMMSQTEAENNSKT